MVETVSVLIPTYDDETYLHETLQSVLEQESVGVTIEPVVVDSSESDAARHIAREYDAVEYAWTEPEGVAAARNVGLDHASGEVIGFCDADDYWHEEKLARQLPLLEDGYDIVISDEYLVDGGKEYYKPSLPVDEIEDEEVYIEYFRCGGVGSRSLLAREECFEEHRFFEELTVREDPHLWTRLFAEFSVGRVAEPLSYKRRREDSLTSNIDENYAMHTKEVDDLVDRYPRLAEYESERKRRAKVMYAKRYLADEGSPRKARPLLFDVVRAGDRSPRLLLFLLVSLFPSTRTALRSFQRLFWSLRNVINTGRT